MKRSCTVAAIGLLATLVTVFAQSPTTQPASAPSSQISKERIKELAVAMEQARQNLARVKQLADRGLATEAEVRQAQFEAMLAEIELQKGSALIKGDDRAAKEANVHKAALRFDYAMAAKDRLAELVKKGVASKDELEAAEAEAALARAELEKETALAKGDARAAREADVAKAKVRLGSALANKDRLAELVKKGAATKAELEVAEAQVAQARKELQAAMEGNGPDSATEESFAGSTQDIVDIIVRLKQTDVSARDKAEKELLKASRFAPTRTAEAVGMIADETLRAAAVEIIKKAQPASGPASQPATTSSPAFAPSTMPASNPVEGENLTIKVLEKGCSFDGCTYDDASKAVEAAVNVARNGGTAIDTTPVLIQSEPQVKWKRVVEVFNLLLKAGFKKITIAA